MSQYELNLSDYWRIIKKRKFSIIFSTFIVALFSFLFIFFQPKSYESWSTVKIEEMQTVAGLLLENLIPNYSRGDALETESNVIASWPVTELAAKNLGLIKKDASKDEVYSVVSDLRADISTEVVPNTNLIKILATSDTPQKAADIANAIAAAYIEENYRSRNLQTKNTRIFIEEQLKLTGDNLAASEDAMRNFKSDGEISGVAVKMQDKLMELKDRLSAALKKYTDKHPTVISLQGQIKDIEKEFNNFPPREIEFARLQREVDLNEKSYAMLRGRLEEARIAEASKVGNATIIDMAVPRAKPLTPGGPAPVFLGAVLGLVLGVVLSFVIESTDTSVGAIEDVEVLLKLPVLGVIPNIQQDKKIVVEKISFGKRLLRGLGILKTPAKAEKKEGDGIPLVAQYAPQSPVAEAYRTLRTNIRFSKERKVVLFTSALNQEGKSTVAINLALTTAQLGNRTLLLSCDMRRPAISKAFGLKKDKGISDMLTGSSKIEEVTKGMTNFLMGDLTWEEVLSTPGIDNLFVISSGRHIINPAELLSSPQMADFLKRSREMYDLIIIDTPPVLPVTDALVLTPLVDAVVMVYQVGRVARSSLLRAKTQLEGAGANILGIVLNHVRPETQRSGVEYYKYYGEEGKKA